MTKTNQTIIIKPGDELTLTIRSQANGDSKPSPIIADPEGRHVLPVPYVSQWSPTAQLTKNDCGPAALTMIVHYLTDHSPTVDQVSHAAGLEANAAYSSFDQLAKAARRFDLTPTYVRPLTQHHIEQQIEAGRPILALVKYDLLQTQEDPNQDSFTGAHFVALVGFNRQTQTIILHDPDRLHGDTFGEFRELPRDVFLKALASTHLTKGNDHSNHGMLFES
jgi:ABC-type bacteriocin/lantibiotic exporter with double-glycine peptidase domain